MYIRDASSKRALKCRLARVEGQLRGVREMIERDEDCAAVATQLSACRSGINHALGAFTTCAIEESRASGKTNTNSQKQNVEEINRLLKLVM